MREIRLRVTYVDKGYDKVINTYLRAPHVLVRKVGINFELKITISTTVFNFILITALS